MLRPSNDSMKSRVLAFREKMMCGPPASNVNPCSSTLRQWPPGQESASRTSQSSSRWAATVSPERPPPRMPISARNLPGCNSGVRILVPRHHHCSVILEAKSEFVEARAAHGAPKTYRILGIEEQISSASRTHEFSAERAVGHAERVQIVYVLAGDAARARLFMRPMLTH